MNFCDRGENMLFFKIMDCSDIQISYGILACLNNEITESVLKDKFYEIKDEMDKEELDWNINDIVMQLPVEWNIYFQAENKNIFV